MVTWFKVDGYQVRALFLNGAVRFDYYHGDTLQRTLTAAPGKEYEARHDSASQQGLQQQAASRHRLSAE